MVYANGGLTNDLAFISHLVYSFRKRERCVVEVGVLHVRTVSEVVFLLCDWSNRPFFFPPRLFSSFLCVGGVWDTVNCLGLAESGLYLGFFFLFEGLFGNSGIYVLDNFIPSAFFYPPYVHLRKEKIYISQSDFWFAAIPRDWAFPRLTLCFSRPRQRIQSQSSHQPIERQLSSGNLGLVWDNRHTLTSHWEARSFNVSSFRFNGKIGMYSTRIVQYTSTIWIS